MKINHYLGLAALGLIISACAVEEMAPQENFSARELTVSASLENNKDTRSTVGEDGSKFLWAKGDQIGVWTGSHFSTFTLKGEGGSTSGEFTYSTTDDETVTSIAVYPAGNHKYSNDNNNITVNYPETYGKAGEQYTVNTNAVMVSNPDTESQSANIAFKHVGGVFKITLNNLPMVATGLKLTTDKVITGDFEIKDEVAKATEAEGDEHKSVTINFAAAESVRGPLDFYFPVPVGEYKSLKLGYYVGSEYFTIREANVTNTVQRTSLVSMPALTIIDINAETETSATVEQQLRTALSSPAATEFTLTSNIKIAEPLEVTKNFTLNLDKYNVAPQTVETRAEAAASFTGQALITVHRGATLTIEGTGSIDTGNNPGIFSAIRMTGGEDTGEAAAKLIINGDPIVQGYYYAITGNGNRHNTEITINDGKYKSYSTDNDPAEAGLCIYHPQNGTLTINGGEFEGFASAIEMRAGTLNIKGGNFTSSASPEQQEANGSGSTMFGTAIAVSQHKTDMNLAVNISGGNFKGVYSLYEKDLENKTGNDKISISVTGGTFDGKVFSENCSSAISKGNFNHPSALGYLTDNAIVSVDMQQAAITSANILINGNSKDITLKNGTLNITNAETDKNAAIALATKNSKLTISDLELNATNAAKALVCGSDETTTVGNTISIEDSEIKAPAGCGIQLKNNHSLTLSNTNITHNYFGITQNGNHTGSTVTVNGGKISGKYTGIYLSNQENGRINTLTVNGAEISSVEESAIEVKKTDITVKNSTLASDVTKQEYKFSADGSGGFGYGIVLAAYEKGRLYEGEKDIETGNTFKLAAGDNAPGIYEYTGMSITTAAELQAYLTKLTDAGSSNSAINIEMDITLSADEEWIPVVIDGYHGAETITINGNGHYIAGLTAPLLGRGFAGSAAVVINNLTIKNSTMTAQENSLDASGIFVGGLDAAVSLTMNDCHAIDCKVTSDKYAGMVGYSSCASNTFNNCTVTRCEFTGLSIGGIAAMAAGGNNTVSNCTVTDCKFNNIDNETGRIDKTGYIVSTINAGVNYYSNLTGSGNVFINEKNTELNNTPLTHAIGRSVDTNVLNEDTQEPKNTLYLDNEKVTSDKTYSLIYDFQ